MKKKETTNGKAKRPKLIHLPEDVANQLERAAKIEGVSQSVYVMQTLRAKFRKDGIE
jgi:hypothetical protein